jgi:hypothetical protein
MMVMNKLQRLNRHNARQFFIGVIMAMPLIFILSLALPNFKAPSVLKFDSENIEVVSSHASPNESVTTHEDTHTDVSQETPTHNNERTKKATQFSHFAKNMKSLSEAQKKAISGNTPRLSIIIPDIGLNRQTLAKIMEVIPPSVTLALSPYSQNHNKVTKQLNGYGFETWMNMAVLTLSTVSDPGGLALNPTHNFERNINALTQQIHHKNNITGLILPSQSLITETPKLWEDIVMDIYGQGFGILDNTSTLLQPRLFFMMIYARHISKVTV